MDHIPALWVWISDRVADLGTVSFYDYVCLVGHAIELRGEVNTKVSSAAEARGYSAEQLAHARKHFAAQFNPVESCNLRFTKPFSDLKYGPMFYVLTLFENYERGLLPFPGSVSEQPAQIMEIFSILQMIKRENEAKASEKLKPNGRNINQNQPRAGRQGSSKGLK